MDGRLGASHRLAFVNNAAVDMGVQIAVQDPVFSSFRHTPQIRIAGSHGSSVCNFSEEPPYSFP